jgi:hypothetical protein
MDDLYEALGSIAAAAHAAGDTIDENIRPEDNQNIQHGFDIFHKGNYMRIGKRSGEQRFEISSPYSFLSVLERNYDDEKLASRAEVDLAALPPEERQQTVYSLLEPELRDASSQYDEFRNAFSQEIAPTEIDLIKITHGDANLWNGFLVRDYIYPFESSFSIADYRRTVSKIRSIRIQTTELVHDVVDVLDTTGSEELTQEPEAKTKPNRQPSPPGFQ